MVQVIQSKPHIQTLDVLRGIAASFVVLHHVLRTVPGLESDTLFTGTVPFWAGHIFLGDLSVTLFFVLSGASLAISAFSKTTPFNIRQFFVRRFFRIYPLYALIIFIYFAFRAVYSGYLASGLASQGTWLTGQFTLPTTPVVWITHLTMTFNLVGIPNNFNNALWSLPIEMQFYLLFPVMIFLLLRFGRTRGALLVILFVGMLYILDHVLRGSLDFIDRLWEFGGGVLMGAFWKEISDFMRRRSSRGIVLISAILFFELARLGIRLILIPVNTFDVIFCFLVVALALGFADWQARTRLERLLVKIGLWSYSLYLIHNLVIAALTPLLHALGLPAIVYLALTFPLVYIAAVLLSRFLYNRFELPFIRLGARYTVTKVPPAAPEVGAVT